MLVPHDEIREPFIEIYSGERQRLVTSIEVLSLTNKRPGEHGRDLYLKKQKEVLESQVHLVEIDLLRGGEHTTAVSRPWAEKKVGRFDYHACDHHFDRWAEYVVFAWRLEMRTPAVVIPLLPGDPSVRLELQPLLDKVYDTGRYQQQIRYRATSPAPPLTASQMEWADQVLGEKGR